MSQTALQPPPGGDQDKGAAFITCTAVMVSVAFPLVFARIFVRARITKSLGWDDFFIVIAMAFSIINLGVNVMSFKNGVGRHAYYLTKENALEVAKWETLGQFMALLGPMFTRLSISVFLLRLFATNKRRRMLLYVLMFFIVTTVIPWFVVALAQCRPITKFWNPATPGHCWSPNILIAVDYFQGSAAALLELVLVAIPIVFLRDVQIPLRIKIGICCVMGLGLFTVVCTIARTVLFRDFEGDDFTWTLVDLLIWVGFEQRISIIAATMPTLRPVYRVVSEKYKLYFSRQSGTYTEFPDDQRHLHRPTKEVHPLELRFRSDLESQSTAVAGTQDDHLYSAEDHGTSAKVSDGNDGIRKTTDISISSLKHELP